MTKKSGTILITTLWILAILSILAIGIGFRVSIEARLSKYNMDKLKVLYLAKAGIVKVQGILLRCNEDCDTIRECGIVVPANIGLSSTEDPLKGIFTENLGDGAFVVSYEEEGKNYYGMMDEDRKININRARQPVLENLLGKGNEDIAASIINWRGTVQIPGGAWDNDYKSLTPSYECKHADFSVLEELMLVKDMTPELFESIKDYITVYGQEDKVNINTATKRVMLAYGLDENWADIIIKIRNGEDKIAGTKDDGVFHNIAKDTESWPLTLGERDILGNSFTTKSNYFRIESKGMVDKSKIGCKIVCVVDKGAKSLKYYRE